MVIDIVILMKVILTIIGTVTAVFGVGYIILVKFNLPNLDKQNTITLSTILIFVALASFIISFIIL
ncbi:hypothetical protein [Acidianus manzaensis]|uniref:Uncharacterized protein n=1 Tax=Acidianus manzaensis TaxID=282676 RepID=A0A1W6K0L3_9CREN|nr:hypothetical protein [Acidianus manzaensis]ARM76027.1 hypothetical protein B6F84_08335 [Acidianus manzaensis]